jgi:hypothetical protein
MWSLWRSGGGRGFLNLANVANLATLGRAEFGEELTASGGRLRRAT